MKVTDSRLWNRFTYGIERWFVRGAQYRLLLIAALIGLISLAGGIAVLVAGSGFERVGEAAWWAFLRLSDPGYLGDDVGTVNRTVSTVLTVLGYVVFLGALVAVMTQWLDARMERLESGLTPVTRNDHVLVLGWTNRTDAIVRELLLSEDRVKRFLRRHGTRGLQVVVMAKDVNASLAQDLRDAVGEAWDEHKVTLRSGTPLRAEHLTRVDHLNASVVIIPGGEFEVGGVGSTDSFTIKTLLSLPLHGREGDDGAGSTEDSVEGAVSELPLVVAEIFDARRVPLAEKAYSGPLEIVSSDAIVSRLLAQNIRHPGLSHVYNEILTHEGGSELYVREHPELDGVPFEGLAEAFEDSIALGVVRRNGERFEPHLNPPPDFRVRASDRFVHLASSYAGTALEKERIGAPWSRGNPGAADVADGERRILILGWSHKVPALLREFTTYEADMFRVRILSTVPRERRSRSLERAGVSQGRRLVIENVEGDYVEAEDLGRVDPTAHDAVVVVGSDRMRGEEESDARTILGSLLLDELGLPSPKTQTILELLDPDNVRLIRTSRGEVIISPLIVSHMLAHVALRSELRAVLDELFTAGGAEITFEPLIAYGGGGGTEEAITFEEIRRVAHSRGEVALGVRAGPRASDVRLNPPSGSRYSFEDAVHVVTLVTFD